LKVKKNWRGREIISTSVRFVAFPETELLLRITFFQEKNETFELGWALNQMEARAPVGPRHPVDGQDRKWLCDFLCPAHRPVSGGTYTATPLE